MSARRSSRPSRTYASVPPDRLGKGFVRGFARQLDEVMRQRREGVVPDDRFRDVRYAEFMRDPLACVEALYAELDLVWTDEHADRIRTCLANKPRDRDHGRHAYRFSDTRLDEATERAFFADSQARFDVPDERL